MEELKQPYERWPAYIVKIEDINSGSYVKVNEEFSPDYVIVGEKKVSRVNIIAIVIDTQSEERFNNLTIDDGTGSIQVRDFGNKYNFARFNIGESIRVIGKPREFNNQIYLVPEIIKPLKDRKWIELRKVELKKQNIIPKPNGEKAYKESSEPKKSAENKESEKRIEKTESNATKHYQEEEIIGDITENKTENKIEKVLNVIKELDTGNGADIEEIIMKSNVLDCEKIITNLIKEGEVFEIKAGKIKVL
ncbi:hypothetical protein HY636_04290 [Candidatus Woesearchaeota archaeon]|nr:hypothetical protein [Candidatus Woesearchaeota archaeon]